MRATLPSSFSLLAAIASAQVPQSADTAAPTFEVASVKPNKTGAPGGSFVMPPGRFTATNIPLKVLITNAYQLSFFQVVGGPAGSARIASTSRPKLLTGAARADQGDGADAAQGAVQARGAHGDADTPIYALVQARADDRLGTELTRSTMDCGPDSRAARRGHGRGGLERGERPRSLFAPGTRVERKPVCQMRLSGRGGATLSLKAGNITMATLANSLRTYAGRGCGQNRSHR